MKKHNIFKSQTSLRKLVLSGIVLASGMAGTVQAASSLASGPVYGGPGQHIVACLVVNTGATPIHFITTDLVGVFKAPLKQNFNSCIGAPLGKYASCSFQASTDTIDQGTAPNQATACKVVIAEAKTNVRGTMFALDFQGDGNTALGQSDLR